jgi:hypothetical protein
MKTENHTPQPEAALISLLTGKPVQEVESEVSEKPTPSRLVYVDKYGLEVPQRPPLMEYDHL